jgi:Tol biopolymer transport system component
MDAATGEVELVLALDEPGGFYGPALSRDGSMVFYDLSDWKNGIFRIMGLNVETGQKTELARSSSQMIHYGPSPDGKWLAFGDREEDAACLRLIPTGGGKSKTLAKLDPGDVINSVVWSADGRHIFFSRGKGKSEASRRWRIPAQGGQAEKFDLTADGLGKMNIRPDGSKLAFNSWRVELEVWAMENFLPAAEEKK